MLRIRLFDLITEPSELSDHSRGARLLRLLADSGTTFFVTDSLVQDQPDQPALSMGNGPDGLLVPETRHARAGHKALNEFRVRLDRMLDSS